MARANEQMTRGDELMQEVREEHRLDREAYEHGTQLILDMVARRERAFMDSMQLMREMHERMREEMRLVRGRMEAQTAAILKLIDRFDSGGCATTS